MNKTSEKERMNALINREGIFGFGFSENNHLDLLNLIVLACTGIIITIFFKGKNDKVHGLTGPASSLIWGYSITALALFLMLFMSFYLFEREKILESKNNLIIKDSNDSLLIILTKLLLNNSLPIILTFGSLIYAIFLNYTFYNRINSGLVPETYHTYEFFFVMLLVIQIGIIIKYMYNLLQKNDGLDSSQNNRQINLLKSVSYIIVLVNFIFLMILNILLYFFSTDG